jgi:diguanylate cyclase (GGDEF)-like protein
MNTSTLLIIDDEPSARDTLEALLAAEGYRILKAADGAEGLVLAERERPDLVFLDVMMPGMDGYEVCRRMRASRSLAELPIVMVSALDDARSRLDGIEAGADDFISKPFNRAELRARTRTITRLNRYRRLLEQEERLGFFDNFDPITHLPNRRLMGEHLAEMRAQAHRQERTLMLISLYIHGLHRINEVLGHAVGDEVLRLIGERLREVLRPADMLARVSGGEFMLLGLSDAPREDSSQMLHAIQQACERLLLVEDRELSVGCSMGAAFYPTDSAGAEDLIQHAEAARASAEADGQSWRYYSAELNAASAARLRLEVELRHALEENQIEVYYQPKLEVATGRCVGAEALARWRHPQHGLVMPGEFIPLAEDSGLILPLGQSVLRQACTQARAWAALGWRGHVAVNVSAKQFHHESCLDSLRAILAETGVDASRIELELTETAIMHGDRVPLDKLAALRELGVGMAIDDFGTGYSSLGRLRDMPVDTLKIDRSFVMPLPDDHRAAQLTRAVIDLARVFAMQTVAEGVETEAQRQFLAEAGCNLFQGYLVAPPLPAEEFEARFVRG